eukprot:EC725978.1.p1 GENE.EC725978.1~~EC725978.1.p1  ORF type:complete len:83 (+),score=1.80 EC725978.1:310-558(+)
MLRDIYNLKPSCSVKIANLIQKHAKLYGASAVPISISADSLNDIERMMSSLGLQDRAESLVRAVVQFIKAQKYLPISEIMRT